VPLYLWFFGIDWFQLALFGVLLAATGFSITLGYHRLFSHMTFRAKLPVRLVTLIFGAAGGYLRSGLKPARTSSEKSFGCSQAAKCPPLSSLL
jgi:hypothetical protein